MKKIVPFLRWLFVDTWPITIYCLCLGFHLLALTYLPVDAPKINRWVAFAFPMTGVLLVLYSIDSNLNLLEDKSLLGIPSEWLKSCPFLKRPQIYNVGVAECVEFAGDICAVRGGPGGDSVEDQLSFLRDEIRSLREDYSRLQNFMGEQIRALERRINKQASEFRTEIDEVSDVMVKVATNGVGLQMLGILLMAHGAIVAYWSGL